MRLVCPACGAIASAEAWASDAHAREAVRIVAELPRDVAVRALAYVALFRPEGGRGVQWKRACRLLSELAALVSEPHIQWEQRAARPNDPRAWGQAMETVISRPPRRLPLESHGYLRKIAYYIADELDRTRDRHFVATERAVHAARPATSVLPGGGDAEPVVWSETAVNFKAMIDRITQPMPEGKKR